jgi:hypothetical protein
VVDPFDVATLRALPELAQKLGVGSFPDPVKAGDLSGATYDVPQRVSTIIFETTDAAGIISRSALDNPRVGPVHTNYSLFRDTPAGGSELRVKLRRIETKRAIPACEAELQAALEHLNAVPELPFDHADLSSAYRGTTP